MTSILNLKDRWKILLDPEKYGYKQCPRCRGGGSSLKDPKYVDVCTRCHGSGLVKKEGAKEA